MNPNYSIVIVNYKTPFFLMNCISSIIRNTIRVTYEIIVVDNNSMDESESIVTREFDKVIWINNSTNEGFGRANNIGAQAAKGDFILFLNSDTIITSHALDKTFELFTNGIENIGAATVSLQYEDGSPQKSVYYSNASYSELLKYNLLYDYFFLRNNKIIKDRQFIQAIHGAFFMIKRDVFNHLGGFDSDFFMYSEEFELCKRILKKGYSLVCFEDVKTFHLEEKSSVSKVWNRRQRQISNALLFKKVKGFFGYIYYLLVLLLNDITNFLFLWKMDSNYRKGYWSNLSDKLSNTSNFIKILMNSHEKPLKIKQT